MDGKSGTVANPLSPTRLESILADLKVVMDNFDENQESKLASEINEDEVSVLYYGDTCECSKRSTCVTKFCSCRKTNKTCSPMCHGGHKGECKNVSVAVCLSLLPCWYS